MRVSSQLPPNDLILSTADALTLDPRGFLLPPRWQHSRGLPDCLDHCFQMKAVVPRDSFPTQAIYPFPQHSVLFLQPAGTCSSTQSGSNASLAFRDYMSQDPLLFSLKSSLALDSGCSKQSVLNSGGLSIMGAWVHGRRPLNPCVRPPILRTGPQTNTLAVI